jgi:hypothetical protein
MASGEAFGSIYANFTVSPRLEDGLRLVEQRRDADGRWLLQNEYRGRTFFRLESVGEPSR